MMMNKDYFFKNELKGFTNEELRKEWENQYNLIKNDQQLRPNNRHTMNAIEELLEERGEEL